MERKTYKKKILKFQILNKISLLPGIKVTKLQDNKSVLIELDNSGWRFFSNDGLIGIETGLYFGNKIVTLRTKIFLYQELLKIVSNWLNGNLVKYD